LDEELVIAAAKETGKVVTVEEHSVIGGLGSAVCDCLSANAPTPVLKIGVNDVFGESGPATKLIAKYGLDAEGLASYGIDESSAKVVIEYEHSSAKATFEFLLVKDADGKCYYALPNSDVTYGIDVTGYDKLLNYVYHTAEETTTE